MVFQPAYGQARRGGAVNIQELALVDISASLWRIGRSPEKLQIFLCYSPIPFCPVRELKSLTIVPHPQGMGTYSCCVLGGYVMLFPPLGRLGWGLQMDGAHPWQLCRSCDFIAQG